MSDEDKEKSKKASFWFVLPKDPNAGYCALQLKYRSVLLSIRFEDSEEGVEDAEETLEYVPGMLVECRREAEVRRVSAEMDEDLNNLLGAGDDE